MFLNLIRNQATGGQHLICSRHLNKNQTENDMPNGECSKRRYPNRNAYCSTFGCNLGPKHDRKSCHYRKKNPNHNDTLIIEKVCCGSTRNTFHHKENQRCWRQDQAIISTNNIISYLDPTLSNKNSYSPSFCNPLRPLLRLSLRPTDRRAPRWYLEYPLQKNIVMNYLVWLIPQLLTPTLQQRWIFTVWLFLKSYQAWTYCSTLYKWWKYEVGGIYHIRVTYPPASWTES